MSTQPYLCIDDVMLLYNLSGFISVGIYNSAGDLLNEDDIYDISVGDYLECRPAETINTEYPPKYAWSYSIFTPNEAAGPNIIRYANTDDHYNRYEP